MELCYLTGYAKIHNMLDIKFIRENSELVREAARKKRLGFDVGRLLAVDEKRRELVSHVDTLRHEQNLHSEEITKGLSGAAREEHLAQAKILKEKLIVEEQELKKIEEEFEGLMLRVPNIPDPSVPEGDSDTDNQEIRRFGEARELQGKDYLTLMKDYDMLDLERGAKVAGFRGYFLKNDGVRLCLSLWQFAIDFFAGKGFIAFLPPSLVRRENLVGTAFLPQAEEDVYKTQDELYLAGTAEVAMMGYLAGEILEEKDLPQKYVAFSPCFRREAGGYGKDEKGIYRVHEFFKVEQVVLAKADHQESVRWHEELTKNSEEMMQFLEIPYRVVINCGADLGLGQVKKYDIEAWLPSEKRYRETHSSSYFHDFQSRRLGIRYRDAEGKLHFVHSLNNTAIATPRILEMLLENHATPDGEVHIPEALRRYVGLDVLKPR